MSGRSAPGLGSGVPFPGKLARFLDLLLAHLGGDTLAVLLGLLALLLFRGRISGSREAEPLMGLHIVLGRAARSAVHDAEIDLSVGIALLGGAAIPLDRLAVVTRDALAVRVHETEETLGLHVALVRGHAEPLRGLGQV